ncbi:MAG: hypothetical protein CMH18_07710 [Methylophaga sp.]|uniref:hypothetical protein n=1 Tax=Methylophaga sp. TaxID=2024840 RepID=UPI000C89D297|nr:hypothetical protein [Methylophaga sp.]MAL49629.1 hypothetical protein [Methylophaga sp.]|tara:strand:- start:215 stop:454 length:240 start_codon:yes stop_codon:yes gene_type:complete
MDNETPEERKRRKARERKKKQRERDEALGVKQYPYSLAATEKDAIERGATAAGFEDETEYLLDLVDSDLSRRGLKRLKQ